MFYQIFLPPQVKQNASIGKTLWKYFGLHNFILNWLVVNNFVSCLIKQIDLLTFMKELVLFGAEKHDSIYNRISYLIEVKSGITCIFL